MGDLVCGIVENGTVCQGRGRGRTGLCVLHYDRVRLHGHPFLVSRRADARYPSDGELVALMQEHQTIGKVAKAVGVRRESLKDYLEIRPELRGRMMEHSITTIRRTPEGRAASREQKLAYGRAYMDRKRKESPEEMRALRRECMRRQIPEQRRRWNQYNRANRAQVTKPTEETWEYLDLIVNDPCVFCGAPSQENDHIEPVTLGGGWEWDNFARSCEQCNRSKGAKRLLHFMAWRAAA